MHETQDIECDGPSRTITFLEVDVSQVIVKPVLKNPPVSVSHDKLR